MARIGIFEVLGGVASLVLLGLGAREIADVRRFTSGARPLDVEFTEVLLGPDQRSFYYVVRANEQGRELKLTLAGNESRRGARGPTNKVGDRTRVLYNPSAHPSARWESHVWDGAIVYFVLGGGLLILLVSAKLLERWGERRRRAAVAAQAASRPSARPR